MKTIKNRIFYLAGGDGSRFGENKLLYPLKVNGVCKPMYRYAFDRLLDIVASTEEYELYVVTCHTEIYSYVKSLETDFSRVYAVDSPDSPLGLSYTIRAGIQAAGATEEETYDTFLVADMPYISQDSLQDFMRAVIDSGKIAGCVAINGRCKNPVMFQARLEPELMELTGDSGGKPVFLKYEGEAYLYQASEEKELADVDYKENI